MKCIECVACYLVDGFGGHIKVTEQNMDRALCAKSWMGGFGLCPMKFVEGESDCPDFESIEDPNEVHNVE
jgi:hypothetical protein